MSRDGHAKKSSVKKNESRVIEKGKWKTESVTGEIMRSRAETQPTGKLHPTSRHKSRFERVVLQIYYKRPKIAIV